MSSPQLREAWSQWRDFADPLTISDDDTAGGLALHGRLFRLCGKHPLKAKHLDAVRQRLRESLGPWLDDEPPEHPDPLARFARTADACAPAWQALFRLDPERADYWGELDREATSLGTPWERGRFWNSPFYTEGSFQPVHALRGEPRADALATLTALWDLASQEKGQRMWRWLRGTSGIWRQGGAFEAASTIHGAAGNGAITAEHLGPLRLTALVAALTTMYEEFTLRCLRRLNEDVPVRAGAVVITKGGRPVRAAVLQREPPEPLPIEPYFREVSGSEAFLRAVAEEPLEDAHRLAFADWLDDHGHAGRAELLRLQCQQAALPSFHPLRQGLAARIDALIAVDGAAWAAGLDYGQGKAWGPHSFRRGLLARVELPADQQPDSLDAAFEQADIRGLAAIGMNNDRVLALLERPWLSRIWAFSIQPHRYQLGLAAVRAMASSPALRHLTSFQLNDAWLAGQMLAALVGELRMPNLISLALTRVGMNGTDAAALAGCAWLRNVRELDVSNNSYLNAAGLRALVTSENVAGLTALDVTSTGIPAHSLEALANSPFLGQLRTLSLRHNHVGNVGMRALVKTPFLKSLTALDLANAQLKPESVKLLTRSEMYRKLHTLELSGNSLKADSFEVLAAAPESTALTALALGGQPISETMTTAIADAPILLHLTALDVRKAKMIDKGVRPLLTSPRLGRLIHLDLRENELNDTVKKELADRWPFVLL